MQIVSLLLFPHYGVNDVHLRSYKTTVTQDAINRLDVATNGGKLITPTTISSVATSFVAPSAESMGVTPIINGWREPRFSFILETIESDFGGTQNKVYYVGHTDRSHDATTMIGGHTGHLAIANDLMFFINATHRLRAQQYVNQKSNQVNQRMLLQGSHQIIYGGTDLATLHQQGVVNRFSMRPTDIFRSQSSLNLLEQEGMLPSNTFDTSGCMIYGASLSNRRNNTPGLYLHDTLSGLKNGVRSAIETGGSEAQAIEESLSLMKDGEFYQDQFVMALSDIIRNIRSTGQFSWGDLVRLAPHIDSITTVFDGNHLQARANEIAYKTGNMHYASLNYAETTDTWNGSDSETLAANLISQSLPAMLLESLIADIRITMTNMTVDGQIAHQIEAAHPMVPEMDSISLAQRVIERIKSELLPTITCYGAMAIKLMVDCSIYNDTLIVISLEGKEERRFAIPTFADNGASPVICHSMDHFQQVTNDIYNIGKMLIERDIAPHADGFLGAQIANTTFNKPMAPPVPNAPMNHAGTNAPPAPPSANTNIPLPKPFGTPPVPR